MTVRLEDRAVLSRLNKIVRKCEGASRCNTDCDYWDGAYCFWRNVFGSTPADWYVKGAILSEEEISIMKILGAATAVKTGEGSIDLLSEEGDCVAGLEIVSSGLFKWMEIGERVEL